jgi:hypothetical protein
MREGLSSLINKQTWTLVDLPPGRKAICCDLTRFEDISLDCVLLLMDRVNVSSRVRTIAYRIRYTIHYLCNVNDTPSSDS